VAKISEAGMQSVGGSGGASAVIVRTDMQNLQGPAVLGQQPTRSTTIELREPAGVTGALQEMVVYEGHLLHGPVRQRFRKN
jgi:hypothetical protein